MPLPNLTHLQFAILEVLGACERSGRDVRAGLAEQRIRKSGPAFYQLMARLEESRFVKGRYETKSIDGQVVKERLYRITGAGARACERTLGFYLKMSVNSRAVLAPEVSAR